MRLALAALGSTTAVGLLSSAARASEETAVLETIREKLEIVGTDHLVVCAAGEESEKAATQMLAAGGTTVQVARVPILGNIETETERVRVDQSATCAIWVRATGSEWELGVVGPCTPPAEPAGIGPVVVAAPIDAMDRDPDESASSPASPATVPSAPATPASAVVLPPKLTVTDLTLNREDHQAVRWHVVDARGVAWSAPRFAETMGDLETMERLNKDLNASKVERKVLFWAGIAGMVLSPVPLAFTESGAYGRNADLAWTSLFLASTGGFTLALHKVGERSEKTRQLRPALYYSRADADALVEAYNGRIDAEQERLDALQESEASAQPESDAEFSSGSTGSHAGSPPEATDPAVPPAPLEDPAPPAAGPSVPDEPPPPADEQSTTETPEPSKAGEAEAGETPADGAETSPPTGDIPAAGVPRTPEEPDPPADGAPAAETAPAPTAATPPPSEAEAAPEADAPSPNTVPPPGPAPTEAEAAVPSASPEAAPETNDSLPAGGAE